MSYTRINIVVPAARKDTINAQLEGLGLGPNNLTVPLGAGQSITHWGASGLFSDTDADAVRNAVLHAERSEGGPFRDMKTSRALDRKNKDKGAK